MRDLPQRRAISLILSLMLTCSLLPGPRESRVETAGAGNMPAAMTDAFRGLGANGWAATTDSPSVPVTTPASSASQSDPSAASPISDGQLRKLIDETLAGSAQGPGSKRIAGILGLDENLIFKQYQHDTPGFDRRFTVPVDPSVNRLILVVREPNLIRCVVTDRSGRLLAHNAGASVRRGEEPQLMSDAETQALYQAEMTIWAVVADRLKSA